MSTALQTLVIVVVIGIAASFLAARYGRGWFGARADEFTAALVGIAGAFIGFYLGAAMGLGPSRFAVYLAALAGALVILWVWRRR